MNENNWDLEKEGKSKEKRVRMIRVALSSVLGIIGLLIILSQTLPIAESLLQGKLLEVKSNSVINPVPESYKQYIQGQFAYYDPGVGYFNNLSQKAREYSPRDFQIDKTILGETIVNEDYKKDMKLSISSVGIDKVNVSSNVESHNEHVYNQYLTRGLAHFKGTPLPGDNGNSFIYGHSAVTSFFNSYPNLPETIFTRLEKVDIGDIIEIYRDEQKLTYTVRNKKIVEDNDFSVFEHNSHREMITLMTCWPVGIGSKRLVVTGELNES